MDYSTAYSSLLLVKPGPLADQEYSLRHGRSAGPEARHRQASYCARFDPGWDLAPLFPYINAVVEKAQYYEKPEYIKFVLHARACAFYPRRGLFAPVADLNEAGDFLKRLLAFVEEVERRRAEIKPNYKRFRPVSPLDLFRLLPGTNCKACGYATCLAFAAALSRQLTSVSNCPHLAIPREETASFPVYDKQGRCIRTVSVSIDTAGLRDAIAAKERRIKALEAQLDAMKTRQDNRLETANARLPASLTPRELEVLRQLARGLTNREISTALQISGHTVKSHVIHIFNKLAVNDRTQASVWAVTHGLL